MTPVYGFNFCCVAFILEISFYSIPLKWNGIGSFNQTIVT